MEIKKGMRVELVNLLSAFNVSGKYTESVSNRVGNKGTVTLISAGVHVSVAWDNNTTNVYTKINLRILDDSDEVSAVNTQDE